MMGGKQSIFAEARDGDLHGLKMCVKQLGKDKVRRLTSVANPGTGLTPLQIACREGHLNVVEYLIDECGADTELKRTMKSGGIWVPPAPPLWYASRNGHLNVVKCLVSRGANINSIGALGESALHAACLNGELEVVKHLVANGADVEAVNINGSTCLDMACREEHYQLVMYLIQTDFNGNLTLKSLYALAEMFIEMLSKGESVDFKVIMAVFVVAVNAIEAKMKCSGNNEECDDSFDMLRLIGCMARMQPEMCEEQNKSFCEVVRRYVSLDRRGEQDGVTPLHIVCYFHQDECNYCNSYPAMDVMRMLLEAGADPQAVDHSRNALLHYLAKAIPISLDLIRLLLDRGAHFDARNDKGECFLDLVAPEDRDQLNSFQYTTLKCLAARAVRKYNIQYQDDQLPKSLLPFVKLH